MKRVRALPITDPPTRSLLPYANELVRACILEGKYHGNAQAHSLLGNMLAEELCALLFSTEDRVCLIPLPLSAERARARGYNQTEVYARLACADVPHLRLRTDILVRTRDTPPQTMLGGMARRANMRGAFAASKLDPNHTYIVFDDVITTGATLTAAMEALRAAGATKIAAITLAY